MSDRREGLKRRLLALDASERRRLAELLMPHTTHGAAPAADGERRLVAYVVPRPEHSVLDTDELQEVMRQHLPSSMHPAVYMQLDTLPRTEFGKVDRNALPVPDRASGDHDAEFMPPRNEVEAAVATIWQEVLGVELIGAFDDFFDLGGESLIATRVISRVRAQFGIDVTPRTLFELPRLSDFAATVSERCEAARSVEHGPEQ